MQFGGCEKHCYIEIVDCQNSKVMSKIKKLSAYGFFIIISLSLSGCFNSQSTDSYPYKPHQILTYNQHTKTADLLLVAAATSGYGGFNFDGYSVGEMTVKVPLGWRVNVECKNESLVLTHSCSIIKDEPISPYGSEVVFGATSPHPSTGIGYGVIAKYSFTLKKVGKYRIACLVIGHEADGMWDWFDITKSGLPAVIITRH